jgi:hypothetical protein
MYIMLYIPYDYRTNTTVAWQCIIQNDMSCINVSWSTGLINECPYTRHSVLDSPGGTAIRRDVLSGLHFILLHEFGLCLGYSRFNLGLPFSRFHTLRTFLQIWNADGHVRPSCVSNRLLDFGFIPQKYLYHDHQHFNSPLKHSYIHI